MFQLKWNKNAVPGKPLKRKLSGTDEEEKREKIRDMTSIDRKETKYEMARPLEEGRPWECKQ